MKKLTLLTLFASLISFSILSGQAADSICDPELLLINTGHDVSTISDKDIKPKRLDTGLEVGTSFSVSPGNFYGPSYYVAPSLVYHMTPRSSVQAGIIFERSSFYPLYESSNEPNNVMPMTRTYVYARGSYMLTPKLVVGGMVYKSYNDVPRLNKYSAPYNYNAQGLGLDMEYKISPSISVGFQMQVENSSYQGLRPGYHYVP